jgi:hypothetical protein
MIEKLMGVFCFLRIRRRRVVLGDTVASPPCLALAMEGDGSTLGVR